jgi:hypothetical protein
MTKPDLEAILDECLHCTSTRGESIERCLQRYPQHAGQLTPLIQVADRIRTTSHPKLSASATKAIERRLLKRATELRPSRAQTGLWPFPSSLRPLVTAFATLIVILALILAGGGGIVYASTDSLPGSPLYGVKRATEEVQLFLAPTGTRRAELHINFAQRRLEEVQALAQAKKGKVDEETLAAIAEETDLALEEVEGAHPADKSDLLEKLASLTERQQAVLKGVQLKAPEAAQEGLNRALEASQQGHERAREALEKEKPGRDVKPTKTPKPTPTPKPTKTPKPTPVPGEHGQGQEPPSAPPGQGDEPLSTPPGQSGKEHGPPAEPPGQSDKDHGPPAEPPGQSGEETLHPVASALGKFFTDALGLDYDEIMGYHEDGMGFDVIAQACWMSTMLEGKVKAGDILAAKKSGDFSFIDPELLGGETPTNWSQFRKAILSSEKVQKNLGAIMSGRAGMDQKQQRITATGNQGQGKGKQGQGLEEDGTSPESPGKGKGGEPTAEPPGQGKDKDKGNDKEKSK